MMSREILKRPINLISKNITETLMRRLMAVASVLLLLLCFAYEQQYNQVTSNQNLSVPIAGATAEIYGINSTVNLDIPVAGSIASVRDAFNTKENREEYIVYEEDTVTTKTITPKKENTIYYVDDEGYLAYMDEEYQDYLWNKLKEYDHTELYEVCIAQSYHESKFDNDLVSSTNDHGMFQINAGNYTWLKKTLGIKSLDNPYDNIDCAVYILAIHMKKYNNIEEALVAYNQGYCGSVKSTEYSRGILYHDLQCLRTL